LEQFNRHFPQTASPRSVVWRLFNLTVSLVDCPRHTERARY
jgi:hypothetical protein